MFGRIVEASALDSPHVLAGKAVLWHGTAGISGWSEDGKDQRDASTDCFRTVEFGTRREKKIFSPIGRLVRNDRRAKFMHGKGSARRAVRDRKDIGVVRHGVLLLQLYALGFWLWYVGLLLCPGGSGLLLCLAGGCDVVVSAKPPRAARLAFSEKPGSKRSCNLFRDLPKPEPHYDPHHGAQSGPPMGPCRLTFTFRY